MSVCVDARVDDVSSREDVLLGEDDEALTKQSDGTCIDR